MVEIRHIKSPDGKICTKVMAEVGMRGIIKILKVIDISMGCKESVK